MGLLPQWRFKPDFVPIMGIIGGNGSGKSALAQDWCLTEAATQGVPVWSNIHVEREGVETHRIRGLLDIMKMEGSIVFLDDVSAVAPAGAHAASSFDVVKELLSMRHRDNLLVYTCPAWRHVDIDIRDVTQRVIGMRALRRKRVPGQLWPNTTLSYARSWDVSGEEVTEITKDTEVTHHGFVRLGELRLDGYDTRAHMELMVDHVVCRVCGLKKRPEYCSNKHTPDEMQAAYGELLTHQPEPLALTSI